MQTRQTHRWHRLPLRHVNHPFHPPRLVVELFRKLATPVHMAVRPSHGGASNGGFTAIQLLKDDPEMAYQALVAIRLDHDAVAGNVRADVEITGDLSKSLATCVADAARPWPVRFGTTACGRTAVGRRRSDRGTLGEATQL
jgi:hypothetical protein